MRSVYRILAYLVALEVVVQTAVIAFAFFGLRAFVAGGGVVSKATEKAHAVPGVEGFVVHGINGQMIVPVIAVLLLVSSFFAKVPGGVLWASITLGTVIVQVVLGILGATIPTLGILHGIVAIGLFGVAVVAARRAEVQPTGSGTTSGHPAGMA
jgi:hypothetical protein